ncbi:hypothetical protein ACM01_14920 [Streptomyces viridochromogenes]|uniref:Uncharacterized protein n=1 Tax=Streptomyces viridochromogenes TaxID=1938 RepID=A0A0J8C8J0_STRVR|nr:hypothetical protein [Streptomyces viridochromogenes]KMS74210.1 hypothetical protein ACM01_14920 [Streptomyces viridochromogenes]
MRVSKLPPYRLSDFRPQHVNLREGEVPSLKCPECKSWHSIRRSLLTPHYPEPGKRCSGSARRIDFDITVEEWGQALVEGDLEARARRSARQFHKPAPPVGQPVHCMSRTAQLSPLERARQAIARHQAGCKICSGGKRCQMPRILAQSEAGGAGLAALDRALRAVARHRVACAGCKKGQFCPLGYELAERKAWTEQTREDVVRQQVRDQREEQTWERGRDRRHARRRASDWRRVEPAVRRIDRDRAQRPTDTDSPNDHTSVPLEPIHVSH